jgi:hypothetical protein
MPPPDSSSIFSPNVQKTGRRPHEKTKYLAHVLQGTREMSLACMGLKEIKEIEPSLLEKKKLLTLGRMGLWRWGEGYGTGLWCTSDAY